MAWVLDCSFSATPDLPDEHSGAAQEIKAQWWQLAGGP